MATIVTLDISPRPPLKKLKVAKVILPVSMADSDLETVADVPVAAKITRKLYVANIAATTSNDDLQVLFGRFGEVTTATVVINPGTGKSRCFAFVEMCSGIEAAIRGTNGLHFQGRPISVNEIAMPIPKPGLRS